MIVLGDHGMADAGGHGGKDVCGNSMSTVVLDWESPKPILCSK